ncbi:SDR family NAD(P)-dependent oxidoreductase [Microvirga aerilata]|uniref:SDR family NAD(P)-dependent oxidoreductase n=2 Tax=Microvirga aerilata TaxID=670292 RepID=A0A936ZB74_9HYPH|nr:SDR family NAD(P)-dependent oxidoreductase [Microvirga aerilata]MBL0404515.1 SDR family NAD(P)-dependent oxidoreductase [Microvirga aerilata]
MASPTAIIVGASSGIGEALARSLAGSGWRVGLAARRLDRLEALAEELGGGARAKRIDLRQVDEARLALASLIEDLGAVDLVILSSGVGEPNPHMSWASEKDTIEVNALGFAAVAQVAMKHFLDRGQGHLVGISSVAKLRGHGDAPSYAATKAFVSTYLDGLRDLAKRRSAGRIAVTEACPGFVDTAMMKAPSAFWVASPEAAAESILKAVRRRAKHAYITPRWGLIGVLLRLMPRPG